MPVFHLRAITGAKAWVGNETNENFGEFADVIAKDEAEARGIAAGNCGDEGDAPWFDPTQTSCEQCDPNGPSRCLGSG